MGVKKKQKPFTCIGKGHGAPCLPATREDWEHERRKPALIQMCERIKKGDEELKHRLPVWTPHCAEFRNNHRATADALMPLPRLMLDFDEKGHSAEIKAKLLKESPLEVLLIEKSVRDGTHVLVELPEGMEIEKAQQLMKEATGFEPDKAVKDVSRCIYMVPESHTLYVSQKMFEVGITKEELRSKKDDVSLREEESKKDDVLQPSNLPTSEGTHQPSTFKHPTSFKGIPYSSIIAEYWRRTGGEPTEGERNNKLHRLAANLRAICENSEEWLLEVLPRFDLTEKEMLTIVHSACKEPTKGSMLINKIVEHLASNIGNNADDELDELDDVEDTNLSPLSSLLETYPSA